MTDAPDPPSRDSLQEELAPPGTIVLRGHLHPGLAAQAAARLMAHDAASGAPGRVRLYTSSRESSAALTLVDTTAARSTPTEVTAVGAGRGPGPGALAVAEDRVAPPLEGPGGALVTLLEAGWRDQRRWPEQVAKATGRPFQPVERTSALPSPSRRKRCSPTG